MHNGKYLDIGIIGRQQDDEGYLSDTVVKGLLVAIQKAKLDEKRMKQEYTNYHTSMGGKESFDKFRRMMHQDIKAFKALLKTAVKLKRRVGWSY